MTVILLLLNSAACFALFWVCGTFLLARDVPTCMRHWVIQVGLLLAMVGAFATGLAPLVHAAGPDWWSVLLRVGVALVALAQYDKAFGIACQVRGILARLRVMPALLVDWWAERWAIAQRHARQRRG